MGKNRVVKIISGSQSLTIPAGVKKVDVRAVLDNDNNYSLSSKGIMFNIGPYGHMYAWGGTQASGELGDGTVIPKSSPVAVLGGILWSRVCATTSNCGGIDRNGQAYGWGFNANGQLGVGDVTPRSSPVAVLGGLQFQRMFIDPGLASHYAITPTGSAYSWGRNESGQLGLGDVTPRSSPIAVLGGLSFSRIEAQNGAIIGLTTSGVAYGWGRNTDGELGVGDVTVRSSPVAVLGGLTFQKILSVLQNSNVSFWGLTTAGALYGWGDNSYGQLGAGDVIPRSSPVAVLGGLTFRDFAVSKNASGGTHVVGLTTAGALYAWGWNGHGQLGLGDITDRSSPIAVLGGIQSISPIAKVYCGLSVNQFGHGSYALLENGAAYAWGQNQDGMLGVGDTTNRSSPVAVLGGLTFARLQPIGSSTRCAIIGVTTSGKLYGWGANINGQLGTGTVTSMSSPTAVLGQQLGVSVNPESVSKSIDVVPGATYEINLGQFNVSFGAVPIAQGQADYVVVEYFA